MIRCTTPRFPTADHELAEVRSLRPMARRQRVTPRPALAVLGAALAAALVVSAPTTVANPTDIQDEGWGAWTGLSQGMVGRRRVPPKFDQPTDERRQDTTALRHADARRQLQRLRSAQNKPAAKQSSALRGSVQRGKGKGKQRGKGASWKNTLADESTQELTTVETTPELTMVEPTPELSTMVATLEATVLQAEATAVVPPNAAWLRTDAAGLYAVSVADLAAGLDESADTVRAQASAGTLSLTTAGQPRSWYFDATADELLFAGEAYKTFYTDENAHHLSLDAADAQPLLLRRRRRSATPSTSRKSRTCSTPPGRWHPSPTPTTGFGITFTAVTRTRSK